MISISVTTLSLLQLGVSKIHIGKKNALEDNKNRVVKIPLLLDLTADFLITIVNIAQKNAVRIA
jgi:hypothetical protein